METYIVGGFVRDTLLGLTPSDKDYVVVGASESWFTGKGFVRVGESFPVYMDDDGNQWAMARTEKSTGTSYTDFEVSTDKVSLEEDLRRRDITINAIAAHLNADGSLGEIVDPYSGQRDLRNKVIRHVSDAFVEDPLRVLRVARFYARYAHLGFTVHPTTVDLMKEIVAKGMLTTISRERIWEETLKALSTNTPDLYFELLSTVGFCENFKSARQALQRISKKTSVPIERWQSLAMRWHAASVSFKPPVSVFNETRDLMAIYELDLLCAGDIVDTFVMCGWYHIVGKKCEFIDKLNPVWVVLDNPYRQERLTSCLRASAGLAVTGYSGIEYGKELRRRRIKAVIDVLYHNS